MSRKRTLVHVVTWSTLTVFIVIVTLLLGIHFYTPIPTTSMMAVTANEKPSFSSEVLQRSKQQRSISGDFKLVEGKNEVRSVPNPSYVQSRPVYQKPIVQKPKLVLPKQLQQKQVSVTGPVSVGLHPHLVTQTVFGFLDFVTTVGNTVMVFTPQTKKVDLIQASSTVQTREIVLLQPTMAEDVVEVITPKSPGSFFRKRQGKAVEIDEDDENEEEQSSITDILESSEYEPQVFPSTMSSTPGSSSDLKFINLIPDLTTSLQQVVKSSITSVVTSEPEVRTEVKVVTAVKSSENSSSLSKGFTLKFLRSSAPTTSTKISTVSGTASVGKTDEEFPVGVVSHNVETKVVNGVTAVHETKVIGTFIGTHYARILESSSSVLPFVVTASRAPSTTTTKTPTTPPQKVPKFIDSVPDKGEWSTLRSVSSSSDLENDERFNEELLENEEGPEEALGLATEEEPTISLIVDVTPTPSASEETTHYILPHQKEKAQIYISAVPSPNAYSKQPQIYVDISPAKSFDLVVTATPSSRKSFRPQSSRPTDSLNRFSNRFNKTPATPVTSSTESNELLLPPETTTEDSSRRSPSRFRNNGRNRSGFKTKQTVEPEIIPTVSVYSNAVTGTVARKFTSRARSTPTNNVKTGTEFKLGSRNGYSQASRQQLITPSTSSSIYRFKLNRPTGRWRFKPSPKPKVNIIKTKEEEELANQKEILLVSNSNGAVYPQGYNENGEPLEIQNVEETRTESNELGQDIEPELTPQTLRVATVTPTDFTDFENSRYLEIATIRSPYVFQAGNVKNTRYITLTKTFTKEMIQPTQASASFGDPSLENILATRPPYEKILEGSNNIATLPLIILGSDTATPPLETVTQTFSTTQLMLKTSILPVLYDGVTTLYTLTQSYFITRLVRAHKTVPPIELFQFVPTKSLTEFNTALQEAGSEHREHLHGSESEGNENDANYEHIVIAPDELTSVGSDFDPSSMDEKIPKNFAGKSPKALSSLKMKGSGDQSGFPDLSNLTPEQLAFLRYFTNGQPHQGLHPMQNPLNNYFQAPLLQSIQPQFHQLQIASSPVILNTVTTVIETKTLRIQFGSKPTQTTIYSTKIIPTQVTTYVTASVPASPAIPNFFQPAPYPLAYVG